MRIVLIDRLGAQNANLSNRFSGIAPLLSSRGHDVVLLDGTLHHRAKRSATILTGLNRAVAAASLIEANALAHDLAELRPDMILAPLCGGIAQGVLMARTCAEEFAETRVILWCDTPSASRFLADDGLTTGIAPLISDALERQAFLLADALILPSEGDLDSLAILGDRTAPTFRARLPALPPQPAEPPAPSREITEVVFAGPMTRRAGLPEFIEAMIKLGKTGLLEKRTVTFLGPVSSAAQGMGREWLGLRARQWPFAFKVLDLTDPPARQRYLAVPQRLGVVIADDPDELIGLAKRHVRLLRGTANRHALLDRIENAVSNALVDTSAEGPGDTSESPGLDWVSLFDTLAELPRAEAPAALKTGVTVCVLHYNRLEHLAAAISSIPDEVDGQPVEILVLDNASDIPHVEAEIRKIAGQRKLLRVIAWEAPLPQAAALNQGLREARFETILFLDDDNYFLTDGVQRLARAVAAGGLDIVVATLDMFDDGVPEPAPSMGRLIFLGAAHSAGLFFNAFGDTAFAVRRDSFSRIGGFNDLGYAYPSLDWVTLAKAQAMGLRIGALQWPAVRYRRDTARADTVANKLDQEGARSLVFEAYGNNFDARLLARYAQKMHLEEL